MVGRAAELGLIADLARELAGGSAGDAGGGAAGSRPLCLALTGEPGVGKTRLARAALDQLAAAGWRTGLARADEWTASLPFRLLTQSLPDPAGRVGPEPPAWRLPDPDTPDPALARIRFLDQVTAALAALAAPPGLALLWDDARWADPSSLEFLPYLMEALRDRPWLVLLTLGEEKLVSNHPLSRALDRLNRDRRLVWIPVARLSPAETRELGAELLGAELPETLAADLFADTSGNPFYVEETIKALTESAELRATATGWVYQPRAARRSIPQGVRAAIEQRTARLPEATRAALRAAAVLGRQFDPAKAAAVLGLSPIDLRDRLEPALAAA